MKNTLPKNKIIIIVLFFLIFLATIAISWSYSSESKKESNNESTAIAKWVQNKIAENFTINTKDTFWRITLNQLLRKMAHFTEYVFIGATCFLFIWFILKKRWLSVLISLFTCPILAYIDEYRQKFSDGRTAGWFDVRVDTYGAILGILIAFAVVFTWEYIYKLKQKIRELEEIKIY